MVSAPVDQAVERMCAEIEREIDLGLWRDLAHDLGARPQNLIERVRTRLLTDADTPEIWHDACLRAALLFEDGGLFDACLERYRKVLAQEEALAQEILPADDAVPLERDALWAQPGPGSDLWLRMLTRWGDQPLSAGEVRQALRQACVQAEHLGREDFQPHDDAWEGVRAARTGISAHAELASRLGVVAYGLLAAGEDQEALARCEEYFRLVAQPEAAMRVASLAPAQRAEIVRWAGALHRSGEVPSGRALLEEVATWDGSALVRAAAPRSVGAVGDADLGRIDPRQLRREIRDVTHWAHVAQRVAEYPDLLDFPAPLIPLPRELLVEWQDHYAARVGFAGWAALSLPAPGDDDGADELVLAGLVKGEAGQWVGAAMHLGVAPDDAGDPASLRQAVQWALGDLAPSSFAVSGSGDAGLEGVANLLAAHPGPGETIAPACAHQGAIWGRNRVNDALVLSCPSCTRRALAIVPLHRVVGEHIRDEATYLRREGLYATLAGQDAPGTMAALRERDGLVSLDLAEHLPHLAAGPATDLSSALFG